VGVFEQQPQRTETLDRLVVKFAGPSRAFAFASPDAMSQALAFDRALGLEALDDASRQVGRGCDITAIESGLGSPQSDQQPRLSLDRKWLDEDSSSEQTEFGKPGGVPRAGTFATDASLRCAELAESAAVQRQTAHPRLRQTSFGDEL
jgi:hypothetical protein